MKKKVTKHTRVVMRNGVNWVASSIDNATQLKKDGYSAIAVTENYSKAQQMILALRSNELVDTLLGRLTLNEKILVKTEIAKIATDFHEGILKK